MYRVALLIAALAVAAVGCGSDDSTATATETETEQTETEETEAEETETGETEIADADSDTDEEASADDALTGSDSFTIEIWADNWMAVYVDGELVGEDSVSITTERSFNSETFTFEASYPFTLAIEGKDFKETDSGLEYIGESNQQMGDGGLIAQVKDSSGSVVAVTSGSWEALVVHRAPLNTDCESDSDPDATCEYEISETPDGWAGTDFDSSSWGTATEWSADAVDPKIGYDEISWDSSASLIWGTDLEVDNTVLFRTTVG